MTQVVMMMKLGIETQTRNDQLTIGATSQTVAVTRERHAIYFRNSSAGVQTITLVPSSVGVAVSGYGITLKPGEVFVDSSTSDDGIGYMCYQGPYQAIASAAGALLSIMEY